MKIEHGDTADNIISNEEIPKIPEIQDISNIQALPDGNTTVKVVKHSKPTDDDIVVKLAKNSPEKEEKSIFSVEDNLTSKNPSP